jgi:hypothetical protein
MNNPSEFATAVNNRILVPVIDHIDKLNITFTQDALHMPTKVNNMTEFIAMTDEYEQANPAVEAADDAVSSSQFMDLDRRLKKIEVFLEELYPPDTEAGPDIVSQEGQAGQNQFSQQDAQAAASIAYSGRCWHPTFECKRWPNLVCAHRPDILAVLDSLRDHRGQLA